MTDANAWVIDVDAKGFEKDVIERSLSCPVVVDFWAPWCGPCKTLGPMLEKRAREGAGRFLLAKVDVDQNPELAQAFRVTGVPTVLALGVGKLLDGFQGILPEAELDAFLDRVAPLGVSAADEVLEAARALVEAGELDAAITELRNHLRQYPEDNPVRLFLSDLLVDAERVPEARKVFDKLPEEAQASAPGKALRARFDFAGRADELPGLEAAVAKDPEDAGARVALGRALAASKDHERALGELLQAVRLDPQGVGGEAKTAMLEIFDLLGLEDPVANDYRFKLSMELLV